MKIRFGNVFLVSTLQCCSNLDCDLVKEMTLVIRIQHLRYYKSMSFFTFGFNLIENNNNGILPRINKKKVPCLVPLFQNFNF